MSRSTFALFIGVFNVALYLFMTIFTLLFTGLYNYGIEEISEDKSLSEESKDTMEKEANEFNGYYLILLADFIFMFVASILMVYGVKKERHQYIAPWVFMSAIGVILELFVIFEIVESETKSDSEVFAYVLSAVICAAIWYPVFQYYQSLKHISHVAVQPCHCSTAGYVAPAQVCAIPSDFSHANAKHVLPTAMLEAPQHTQAVYPSVASYEV